MSVFLLTIPKLTRKHGEIYNHRELLPELQAAGYRFTTTSDTEIILCAYMHFGKDFVEKLNGIFAFAIWDDTTRELLLYRDRAGTKPLFYTQTGSSFVFGSEPKALFCHPDVTPSIDKNSLQEILAVGPARTSGNGVFTGVKEGADCLCDWLQLQVILLSDPM